MHCMTARCNVRKSLLCNILVAVALPWLVLGCGGGPTAPGAAPTPQSDAAVAPPAPPRSGALCLCGRHTSADAGSDAGSANAGARSKPDAATRAVASALRGKL